LSTWLQRWRSARAPEVFHAKVVVSAEGNSDEQLVWLIVRDEADGWNTVVVYPDTKEAFLLSQLPEIEDAKAVARDWARNYKVKDVVEWIPGPPPKK
jgi:hypothetical protein